MSRCLPVLAAFLCFAAFDQAAAQTAAPAPLSVSASAAPPATGIVGRVTDEAGAALEGVSVLAMGTTVAMARTDAHGFFTLRVPPGPYVLRATRDGYISTYREAVYVRNDDRLSRSITLIRADEGDARLVLASTAQPDVLDEPAGTPDDAGRTLSEAAWRLRHLPRTALRDERPVAAAWQGSTGRPASPWTLADVTGRVDVVTTGALNADGELPASQWPRGVAYVVLGAPVGRHGEWSVRTSLAGGERAAWTLAGDYWSNEDRRHAFRAGVSYSAQTFADDVVIGQSLAPVDTVRRAGGVYFSDIWTLTPALTIESGLRVERYDYLADPTLVSARVGLRQELPGGFAIVAAASPHEVAPGAGEFAAPSTAGLWLPPERTFSALEPGGALDAQGIAAYEVGIDAPLPGAAASAVGPRLRIRRFVERSTNQVATVFGLDDASQVGHYYLASPGHVDVDGWIIGIAGEIGPSVVASIDYSRTFAMWRGGATAEAVFERAGSVLRRGVEQLHDITASVDADVPVTSTKINVALRLNSGYSRPYTALGGFDARYALEVRQLLPVRPLGRGDVNLLVSIRTLHRELQEPGGYYDELLTVAPPVRLTCGLQMRF